MIQLFYLGCFAIHFGSQIFMTFVSGLSLYFSLPRHTFGRCQEILFPKYFALNSILSISTLILFVKAVANNMNSTIFIQIVTLTVCASIELIIRLYLSPSLVFLMAEKYKFEKVAGTGQEIGHHLQGLILKNCPRYQFVHKKFRKLHMRVAMGNMVTLLCTFIHLSYLASKIELL